MQSAFKDSRFDPIQPHELPTLQCTLSLLTNYEEASNYKDWIVGVHGIKISFTISDEYENSNTYSATYLPGVASEQRWTQVETVVSLIRKAGYEFRVTQEILDKVKVIRYQSSKKTLTWHEYMKRKSDFQQ